MPTVEERLAYLEGRAEDHGSSISDLRADIRDLRSEINRGFAAVDAKFTWVIGVQVTTLVMIGGALLGLFFRAPRF